ncbi:DUF2188 domain-containing protein [Mycoplasma sp. 1573]
MAEVVKKEASTVYYVVNHTDSLGNKGWGIKVRGGRILKHTKTQKEAIDYAKSIKNCETIMLQSKEGSFRKL